MTVINTFFYKKHTFWFQPRCFLTFSKIKPKMLNIISTKIQGDSYIVMILLSFICLLRCY